MEQSKQKLVDKTVDFFRQRTGVTVSRDDAHQAIENIAKVFALLDRWDRRSANRDREEKHTKEKSPLVEATQRYSFYEREEQPCNRKDLLTQSAGRTLSD